MSALVLDGVSTFPRILSPLVCHCTTSCFPLLDGVSAFPRILSPPVSHCLPSCFPLSCLPLSPIVHLLVSLCWMVCPPSRGSFGRLFHPSPSLSPILSPLMSPSLSPSLSPSSSSFLIFLFPLVGWCVWLPEAFSLFSACLPSCFPLLDGVSTFPTALSGLSPSLSPFLFPFVSWYPVLRQS